MVKDPAPIDADEMARTLTAIQRATGPFCSRPDPIFPTHVICLALEQRGLIVRRRQTVGGFIEWEAVDRGA
jgi:hypothetical protein